MQSRMAAQLKGLFVLPPLLYRREFTFPSAGGLFILLLVLHLPKTELCMLKTNR